MEIIKQKFFEVTTSVLPVTLIALVLNFTLTPLGGPLTARLIIGAALIIAGLTIFLFGVDFGITPIGNHMGELITRPNKIIVITAAGLLLGFFVSIAEPDLHILASQVSTVTDGAISKSSIVVYVSVGIAVMLSVGLVRIVYNIPLFKVLTVLYLIIFGIAVITSREFLAISFDASGATTGALTVPFILAIGHGVASLKKDSKASEKDSFGLVAIASTGAILSVMLMSILSKRQELSGSLDVAVGAGDSIIEPFISKIGHINYEVLLALLPILVLYVSTVPIANRLRIVTAKYDFIRICKGVFYTHVGLVLFLTGVNGGFLDVGVMIGYKLASYSSPVYLIASGFILGLVTILAEPAVYVLTRQVEDVTSGYIKRKDITLALSLGVGISVALSMLRILVPEIQLWHYLLPGYLVAVGLMYIVPKLFIGIAFDAGGVASGPMTATFILAFAQGAAERIDHANVLVDGFGIIAMVAMTPIITLQLMGLIYKIKSEKTQKSILKESGGMK